MPELFAEDELAKQIAKCLSDINKILNKYNGKESDIPYKDEYWELTAQYRRLTANR